MPYSRQDTQSKLQTNHWMNLFTIQPVLYTITIIVIVTKTLSKRQKQRKNENCKLPTASLVYD